MAFWTFPLGLIGTALVMLGGLTFGLVVRELQRHAASQVLCKRWIHTAGVLLTPGAVSFLLGSLLTHLVSGAWPWFLLGSALGACVGSLAYLGAALFVARTWQGRLLDLREPRCLSPEGERVCQEFWHGKPQYLAAFLDAVLESKAADALAPQVVERLALLTPEATHVSSRHTGNDELRRLLMDRLREREARLLDQVAGEEEERDAIKAHTHQRMLEVDHMTREQLREELGV